MMIDRNQVPDILENIKDAMSLPNNTGDDKVLHNACLLLGATIEAVMSIATSLETLAALEGEKRDRERVTLGLAPISG